MAEPKRLEGSYCPGCGERNLFLAVKDGWEWAYCGRLGDTLETSHTSYRVRELKKALPATKLAGEEE